MELVTTGACALQDIEYGAKAYVYFTVDENGNRTNDFDYNDIFEVVDDSDEVYWHCRGCGDDFHEWIEVKKHLK